uniref:Uncharacterized protein n=1 Tax=Gorilla gorilla gorilla TaxID=9595 RepID=A0A2I2YTT8_GORGO
MAMDLDALLEIEEKVADKEVEKAYRQKASSSELFHQHSQALEVLTDAAAGAAYDKVRKAKKQAAERTQKLDEKRKKVKARDQTGFPAAGGTAEADPGADTPGA